MLHRFVVHPNASLNKVNPQLIRFLQLNREPRVRNRVQLVHKLEQRPLLQQSVADRVLDRRQDRKEVNVVDLEVPQGVSEAVRQTRLQSQQWLDGHFVDLLEAFAVDAGEVLNLKLLDQVFVGV